MNIKKIAEEINEEAFKFNIGKLQQIRKEIKGLKRQPGTKIFTKATTFENYAFHYGGRKELQFNIGEEDEGIRYGLGFSIETSQSLPDVTILYPKIDKLNMLFKDNPAIFSDYKYWYYQNGRSDIMEMQEIIDDLKHPQTFIFFGKLVDINNVNIIEILKEFDKMILIYKNIETK